ncbi:MAG: hypothetical protein AAFX53_03110 [Bacteroidota bacterium]
MKTLPSFFNLLITSLLFLGWSCSTDDNDNQEQETRIDAEAVIATVTDGEWRIASYVNEEVDRTDDFLGYVFTFNTDGTLGATNGSTAVSGAWTITDLEDDDDALEETDVDFELFFAGPDLFRELSEDWEIRERTDNRIRMTDNDDDVDGDDESQGSDILIFERM